MTIRQLSVSDELMLRKWMLSRDTEFALHRQLKDYFLAPTKMFGTSIVFDGDLVHALGFWSSYEGKSYIHRYVGDVAYLEELRAWLQYPCQLFLETPQLEKAEMSAWAKVLSVTQGYVVDHPAYSGVFSRVAPRFSGAVYEHD
jgi:hypothetical protein